MGATMQQIRQVFRIHTRVERDQLCTPTPILSASWSDAPPALCIAKRTRVHEEDIVKFPSLGWVLWSCPSLHQGKIAG